jgi:fatty acid desaturase
MARILLLKVQTLERGQSISPRRLRTKAVTDMMANLLRDRDGMLPHGLALCYGILGYGGGLSLMASSSSMANLAGILLLAHAMVISAYLLHECAHNIIFTANAYNARLGACLSWITGSCYARFEDLQRKHFRHHVERADVIGFDYRQRITRYPLLVKLIAMLEWAYIPAVEILLHTLVIVLPFVAADYGPRRRRVLLVLAVRVSLFALLCSVSMRAGLLYPVAYMVFLSVLRFMDAHQHSYVLIESRDGAAPPGAGPRDREYEYRNTYSNLLSVRHPWLNLLTLNFAYHNAHHDRPIVPWYRLPALHRSLYGEDTRQVLRFPDLVKAYHRYRVARAFHPAAAAMQPHAGKGPDMMGIDGVSFLVPV